MEVVISRTTEIGNVSWRARVFHRLDCPYVKRIVQIVRLERSEAIEQGMNPCARCLSDDPAWEW